MIPFASQRGSGQDLASHLLNAYDNELAEVAHLRGSIAHDLHGAFKEWQVQAENLTRCEKYLYSLSINPDPAQGPLTRDQYMDYIRRAEDTLGLGDQPRAIVFHIKDGREHCHVVWSRIDADHEKAVHLAFDRDKLMRVTRGFARDHGLSLPPGYEKSRHVGQLSLYERAQLQRTGLSLDDHKRQVTEAWQQSDNARTFVHALSERGYMLATGNRPYVVVDLYGNVNALPRLIDDKSIRTKDIRAFLEKEFPPEALPSVEEAQKLVADHRKQVERSVREEDYADKLAELKHAQAERRHVLEQQRESLKYRQHALRLAQQAKHRAERDKLRAGHLALMRNVRQERYEHRPTGLAEFLGRVSGMSFLRHKFQHYQDTKRLRAYLDDRAQLKIRQAQEAATLALRLRLQGAHIERQCRSLEKVDKREFSAFMRDQQCAQRIRARGKDGAMPSLVQILPGRRRAPGRGTVPDVMAAFEQARHAPRSPFPDVMAAFERATAVLRKERREQRDGEGPEKPRPLTPSHHRKGHEPDRER
ncbi:relaxase/mobilization nuclease domain-containing protein [uncultured Pseudomonas sp.]|uniref:relaxase/mobilization nuclease domain-containing protein n=1 Tax=uncultured Pseudomonas sp. TaxID=114707 RepID=UPI0026131E7C|nr:relaxase/mobilization nuclease domain-containing protein [uncultured Pseudomonas sp.]